MEKTDLSLTHDDEDSYHEKKSYNVSGYHQSTNEQTESGFPPTRIDSSSLYYTTESYHSAPYPSVYGTATTRPPFLPYNHKNVDTVDQRSLSTPYRHPYPLYDYHDQVYSQSQLSSDVYSVGNPASMEEESVGFGCHERQRGFENLTSAPMNVNLHVEKSSHSLTPPPLIKTQTSELLPSNYHQQTPGLRFPYFQSLGNQDRAAMSGIPNSDPLDLRKTDAIEDGSLQEVGGAKGENIFHQTDRGEENERFYQFPSSVDTRGFEVMKNAKCFRTSSEGDERGITHQHVKRFQTSDVVADTSERETTLQNIKCFQTSHTGSDESVREITPQNIKCFQTSHTGGDVSEREITPRDKDSAITEKGYVESHSKVVSGMDTVESDLKSGVGTGLESGIETKSQHVEKCSQDTTKNSDTTHNESSISKDFPEISQNPYSYKYVTKPPDKDYHENSGHANSHKSVSKLSDKDYKEISDHIRIINSYRSDSMLANKDSNVRIEGTSKSESGEEWYANRQELLSELQMSDRQVKEKEKENGQNKDQQSGSTHNTLGDLNGRVSNQPLCVLDKNPCNSGIDIVNIVSGNGNSDSGNSDSGNDKNCGGNDNKNSGNNCGNDTTSGNNDKKDGNNCGNNDDKKGGNNCGNNDKEDGNDKDDDVCVDNSHSEKAGVTSTYYDDSRKIEDENDDDDDDLRKDEDDEDDLRKDEDDDEDEQKDAEDTPNFICGYCDQVFTDNSSLVRHRCELAPEPSNQVRSDGEESATLLGKRRKMGSKGDTVGKRSRSDVYGCSINNDVKGDDDECTPKNDVDDVDGECTPTNDSKPDDDCIADDDDCIADDDDYTTNNDNTDDGYFPKNDATDDATDDVPSDFPKNDATDDATDDVPSDFPKNDVTDDDYPPNNDATADDLKIEDSSTRAEPVRRSSRKNKAKVKMKEWLDEEEEEDPYICGECGQTFDKEKLLLKHMKLHNNSDYEDFSGSEASIDQWRPRSHRPKRKASMRQISYDETSEGLGQSTRGSKRRTKSEILSGGYVGLDDQLTYYRRKRSSGGNSTGGVYVGLDDQSYNVRGGRQSSGDNSSSIIRKSCVVCSEVFENEILLKDHVYEHCEDVPADQKTLLCAYCEKHFIGAICLTNHEDRHVENGDEKLVRVPPINVCVENKYKCPRCEKGFKLKGYLKLHMKTHKSKTYKCSQCEESFLTKGDYLVHKKSHKVKQEYVCELCGKEYTYKSGLSIHMKSHSDKNKQTFDCVTCNRSFYSQGHLAIHIKGHKHAGTKKHRCQECGYQVYDEEKLFRHLESHINQDPFVCPFCGKLFMKKSTFVKHKKKHSGENMCDVCGKAFSHRSGLDRHYTIHSGEKPYKCEQCDKSFSQQSNLTTHQRQHSGEKPFMCEICAQSFTNKCSLVRHMAKHSESETAGLAGISMVNKNWMWP